MAEATFLSFFTDSEWKDAEGDFVWASSTWRSDERADFDKLLTGLVKRFPEEVKLKMFQQTPIEGPFEEPDQLTPLNDMKLDPRIVLGNVRVEFHKRIPSVTNREGKVGSVRVLCLAFPPTYSKDGHRAIVTLQGHNGNWNMWYGVFLEREKDKWQVKLFWQTPIH